MKTWQLLTAAVLGYLGFEYLQKGGALTVSDVIPDAFNPGSPDNQAAPATPATRSSIGAYPLRRGSKGELVRLLQANLNITADGVFGVNTETALYQRFGVKEIASADQMHSLFSTGAMVVAKPTKPVAPTIPARTPVATRPVKPARTVVPAKPATPVKPAKPPRAATTTLPAVTVTAPRPTAPVVPLAALQVVYNGFWDAKPGYTGYLKNRIDTAPVKGLATLSDAQLRVFIQAYNRQFHGLNLSFGGKSERAVPTLLGDMNKLSSSRLSFDPAYKALLARVQRLS